MGERVTAVLLNWNGRADTERCVRSLLDDAGAARIVVVDNGSRGGEAAALAATFAGERSVQVVPLPRNRGFAGGVNAGVRVALDGGADRVLLLNNDAVVERGAVASLGAALDGDPGAAAAGPLILQDDGSRRAWFAGGGLLLPLGQALHPGHGARAAAPAGPTVTSRWLTFCAVLVRRSAWERVGPLEEAYFAYFEDVDWCVRAERAGLRLLHCPAAVVLHRGSGSAGRRSPLQCYLVYRGRVTLVRRHVGALRRLLLFWPWLLLVRLPHDAVKFLVLRGPATSIACIAGVIDGVRGGPPRRFRDLLGLDGDTA